MFCHLVRDNVLSCSMWPFQNRKYILTWTLSYFGLTHHLFFKRILIVSVLFLSSCHGPHGLTFTWRGCCGLCLWHKPAQLAHSFLFSSCVCFCLYGPFNCFSFYKFSQQLSAFHSVLPAGLIFVLLVFSTVYLFMEVSLSPDIILCSWLGLKHQLTLVMLRHLHINGVSG